MRGHDPECDSRGAGTHAAGTFRGHQRPRDCADWWWCAAEESGQTHPGRDGFASFYRGRSAGFGGAGHREDAERFPIVAAGLHRLKSLSVVSFAFLVSEKYRVANFRSLAFFV